MTEVKLTAEQERLFANATLQPNGCRLWKGGKNQKGYGTALFRAKAWRAHRASYTAFRGDIPDDKLVCHTCDTPCCIEPAHLFVGTNSDNMQDMVRKGRGRCLIGSDQSHFKSGHAPRGADGSGAKVSEQDAINIICRAGEGGPARAIAAEFGIHRTTVGKILNGVTWKHLPRTAGRAHLASSGKGE